MFDLPPFPGFRPEAFAFLRDLAQHNDRDWFKPRKALYEDEVLWPLRCLVADAGQRTAAQGLNLTGDPKQSVFRIYRDTRFSKDKLPYKTHAGAVLSRTGSRKENGVVYVHVQPERCFLGAGFWHPEMPVLRAWRARMVGHPEDFVHLTETLAANGLTLETNDTLKRMPRGFEPYADAPLAEQLRWQSFLVTQPVPDEALQTPAFADTVVAFAQAAHPLLAYGWDVEAAPAA